MVCNCGSSSVNWSNKIKKSSSRAREVIGKEALNHEDIVFVFKQIPI